MSHIRWKPSVTVAAIIERDGRYLLVEEHTPEGLRLNNPAGHLEPGESPLQAVVREALEETGCDFVPQALVGVYLSRFTRPANGDDVTYLRLAFAGTVGEPRPGRSLDAEIVRTLWLKPEQIAAERARHRSPLLMRCIDDHRAGRRYPLELLVTDPSVSLPEIKRRAAASARAAAPAYCAHTISRENPMTQPHIAQKAPNPVAVEAGKDYWWCQCGQSKSQPFCDGSHKGGPFTPVKYSARESKTVYFCGCKQSAAKPLCDGTHKKL